MHGVMETIILAFTIGLTGALAPGPTLVAAINASLKGGWLMGPKIAMGHALAEVVIFLLIVLGLASMLEEHTNLVAGIGGTALIIFGILTLSGSRKATMTNNEGNFSTNPYLAGLLTSVANPFFWVWWLSVGSALVLAELKSGIILAVLFMVGHWGADFGWYTLVSTSLDQGKTLLSETNYRNILSLCGIFLILFGIYYLNGI